MCHITSTPHPCGHTSTHLLMPCNAPKLPAPSSHDDYCSAPKVQYLTARQACGFTCAICPRSRRGSASPGEGGPEPMDEAGAELAKRDSKLVGGKENVRGGGG